MKHFRTFYAKVTNSGETPRIVLTDPRQQKRRILQFDNDAGFNNSLLDTVKKHLESRGLNIIGFGESKEGYTIISDSWASKTADKFIQI